MSSLRVRAQNKLLSKLGAAKPSKNVQFDNAHANFEKVHNNVIALEGALRGFIVSLKGFHVSAQVLYSAIEAMGNSPDNSAEMKQSITDLKNAFVHVDVTAFEDTAKKFENRVLRPAVGWTGRGAALKNQVAEFHEEKLGYDHYTRKVMGLREARDKRSVAGKNEKLKDVEKLVRNEQKLAASTNAYSKISDTTVSNLRDFVNTSETTLGPVIQRVLEFRVQYAARMADESRVFQNMVRHDSVNDNVLGTLEKSNTGQPPVPIPDVDVPVHALSFDTFVGDAPPSAPTSTASKTASKEWLPPDMPPLPTPAPLGSAGHMTASPLSPSSFAQSPTSPSSANPFFGDDFGFAATKTATMPPSSPSSPSSASFTPWDDIPPPPPLPQEKSAFSDGRMQFNTMPAIPSAPPENVGWDSFSEYNMR